MPLDEYAAAAALLGEAAGTPGLPADLRAKALALIPRLQASQRAADAVRVPCVFAALPPGQCGYYVGNPPRPIPGGGLGLAAAWRAIRGELPLCTELVGDKALHPVSAVKHALRRAARWAEQEAGSKALAAAILRIRVRDGRLHYVEPEGVTPIDPRPRVNSASTDLHIPGHLAEDASIVTEGHAP